MKWSDDGIVIRLAPFSEKGYTLTVLTQSNGKQSGLFQKTKNAPTLHIGDRVSLHWNARLPEHLGRFTVEQSHSTAHQLFMDAWRLWLVQHICEQANTLPDRHPYDYLYALIARFINDAAIDADINMFAHLSLLEKEMLAELGFGIDLSICCVTQSRGSLTHISPKTGRAVSASAAQPYIDKLLTLPPFWIHSHEDQQQELQLSWIDVLNGLNVTRYFFQKWIPRKDNKALFFHDSLIN